MVKRLLKYPQILFKANICGGSMYIVPFV